jgi:hypothetical protein
MSIFERSLVYEWHQSKRTLISVFGCGWKNPFCFIINSLIQNVLSPFFEVQIYSNIHADIPHQFDQKLN